MLSHEDEEGQPKRADVQFAVGIAHQTNRAALARGSRPIAVGHVHLSSRQHPSAPRTPRTPSFFFYLSPPCGFGQPRTCTAASWLRLIPLALLAHRSFLHTRSHACKYITPEPTLIFQQTCFGLASPLSYRPRQPLLLLCIFNRRPLFFLWIITSDSSHIFVDAIIRLIEAFCQTRKMIISAIANRPTHAPGLNPAANHLY